MVGEELRAARLAANLTQEKLADEAGISRNYISLLELNRKSPTVDLLLGLCDTLGVSAADLIRRVENDAPRRRRRRSRR
jgi:transcriptional regulator with XRE-family HTH domain